MPRVGSSRHSDGGRVAGRVEHDRQRQALALAAREVARVPAGERRIPGPTPASAAAASLLADALVDEIVASGSAAAARRGPSAATRPRVGAQQPGAHGAAASTCRRRCAPSARRARRGRARATTPAQDRRAAGAARARRRRIAAPALAPRLRRRAAPAARGAAGAAAGSSGSRPVLRAGPLGARRDPDARGGRSDRHGAQQAARRGSRARARARVRPFQELGRGRRRSRRAPSTMAITRSAEPRQRSRRCSASTIAVSHSSLSRRSSAISSSPATGSSCEVGSSSTSSAGARRARRRARRAGARRRRASAVERSSSGSIPSASAASSTPRATAAAPRPRFSSGKASSAAHRPHHDLGLGVLEERADDRARARRAVVAHVHAPDDDAARESSPPWKCGTRPLAARSSVDLPEPEAPGEHHELARRDARATRRRSAGPTRLRVACR